MRWGRRMIKPRIRIATATVFLACLTMAPVFAQDYGRPVLRYGDTSGWYYDGRDDNRDFPTNGLFPGNFATNPANAWIGAAGISEARPGVLPLPTLRKLSSNRRGMKPPIAPIVIAPMIGRSPDSLARAVHAIDVDCSCFKTKNPAARR